MGTSIDYRRVGCGIGYSQFVYFEHRAFCYGCVMKTLSSEVAKDGVNVNFIIPGKIDDDRVGELDGTNAKRQGKTVEEIRKRFETQIPAGCYGKVEEFAKTAAFLVSDAASYITGQMIRVDGGRIRSI